MFERLTKIWKLAKKHLTEVQTKLLAAKIKKHKAKIVKIENGKKALVLKIAKKKKEAGKDFKITQDDSKSFTKFKMASRKERISLEEISKKVTTKALHNASKIIEIKKKLAENSQNASAILEKTLKDLAKKRKEFKAKIAQIEKDKKSFMRPMAKRLKKEGKATFEISASERNRVAGFKRQEADIKNQDSLLKKQMKSLIHSKRSYTAISEKANISIAKIEKNMKILKISAEAPMKHRESTEKLATIQKERNALIDQAISNSVTAGDGLTFAPAEKAAISSLKEKESKLQKIRKRTQRIIKLTEEKRSRHSSIKPEATPKKTYNKNTRGRE